MLDAFPVELVDRVIDFVDSRDDILSLALTSRAYLEHLRLLLDYREIWAPFDSIRFWKHLTTTPHAHLIRTLTIHQRDDVDPIRMPVEFRDPGDDSDVEGSESEEEEEEASEGETESLILRALENLVGLSSFSWRYVELCRFDSIGYDKIWDALHTSCPSLRKISVWEGFRVLFDEGSEGKRNASLCKLRNIETLEYTITLIGAVTSSHSSLSAISPLYIPHFLANNPKLRFVELEARFGVAHMDHSFADVHLPHLRSLSLHAIHLESKVLCDFLRRNPTIEALHLYRCMNTSGDIFRFLEQGDLPNLRDYRFQNVPYIPVCMARPPLRHLEGIPLVELMSEDDAVGRAFSAVASTLKTITVPEVDSNDAVLDVGADWVKKLVPDVRIFF
ncbi:hypothetical protein JAAARDRAFT_206795 [Jaapia argillacea MUCL 33604]|uniref:F-box domain-containing protein n=1 Tax=Jaapia argillacea MUCL 33604 TaxID=933084 RepID=A0A067PW19_9AGAM|nr:hypothetical protein JAAARDRAFT_206795 [Jaapia argillacea MUCL 33604]